jgi:hypothetical protein
MEWNNEPEFMGKPAERLRVHVKNKAARALP